eukprot:GFUD01032209.1.p1 GENE.GFUD01032209.1~~GFUD01032209.1.p1  ORF type:complete len:378 (-),score=123.90 GFUD01032209.1:375-1508(-)
MRDVNKFLTEIKASSNADVGARWAKVEEHYNKKLWHQLTVQLQAIIKEPSMQDKLISIYQDFITDFEAKMDPLSLVMIGMVVLERFTNSEEAVVFMEKIGDKVKMHKEAFALTKVLLGRIKLHKYEQHKETKAIIDEVDTLLSEVDGVSPVHSHFYLLSSDLYRIQGKHKDFYRSSLRFLGCTDIADLSQQEQAKHAFFLSLAAMLGEKVFNFGELLAHKVLDSLKGGENEWLIDILFAFNSGDVSKFRALKPKWSTQPDLAANEALLFEKVCLLCLMEMTFRREATARQISFAEIAAATTLPVDQVEMLIMKALSQGLVRGRIDEVDQTVSLTWVQPRVLDKQQLETMTKKIDSWCQSVQSMEVLIENKAGEILTY